MTLKETKKVLFITPGATRVGANIYLLNFLKWFKENSDIPFLTLYGYGGDLEDEFAKLSPTFKFDVWDERDGVFSKMFRKIREMTGSKRRRISSKIRNENIGLIYSNTVIQHRLLSMFSDLNVPVISHCHELDSVLYLTGIEDFRKTQELTTHYLADSKAVQNNLIKNHLVPAENTELCYATIPLKSFTKENLRERKKMVCSELGIPESAFIVGASGTLNWRKAPEIFIQIARKILIENQDLPIYFVWVGGAEKGDFSLYEVKHDVRKLGLEDRIFFLEHKSNPLDYYSALDVFSMVSREEPLGLVCVEAGSLGKPIICFENAGGAPEIGLEGGCFTVPYLDLDVFADRIMKLFFDPALKEKMGNYISDRVRKHFDISNSAPRILETIERFLNKKDVF